MMRSHARGRAPSVVPLALALIAGAALVPVACALQSQGLEQATTGGGGTSGSTSGTGGASATTGSTTGTVGSSGAGSTTGSTAAGSTAASSAAASSSSTAASSSSTAASSSSGGPTSEGKTCDAIYQANASAPTGLHWIDPLSSGTPFQVYCEMITGGGDTGGWTLTLKIDGTKTTFAYDQAPWTDTTPFGTPDLDKTEGKLPSFYTVPMTKVRVGMLASDNVQRWLTLPDSVGGGGKTLKDVVAAGPTTTAGHAAWEGLVPGVATEPNLCTEGFNLTGYNFHLRLGFMEDNGSGCPSANTYIGFGPDWFAVNNSTPPNTDGPASGNFRDTYGGFVHVTIATWGYLLVR